MLADPLGYQQTAVRKALDPANLRPRILLADAVGLGKTLEIGMILSELIRRGRGERILIVTPRHVLEQMQHEMWSRFAMPFVRLDSARHPAGPPEAARHPQPVHLLQAGHHLDRHAQERPLPGPPATSSRWDAVVIDESHNVTNSATLNNRLARVLAPNTDALILASATPHNGKPESFAELIRLLEPTAVRPDGTVIEDEVRRWSSGGTGTAPRWPARSARTGPSARSRRTGWCPPPRPRTRWPASWTRCGCTRHAAAPRTRGRAATLFPWTLAKAFLSSPAALLETIRERIRRLGDHPTAGQEREIEALLRLEALAAQGGRHQLGASTPGCSATCASSASARAARRGW